MSAILNAALTSLAVPDLTAHCRTEAERFRAGQPHDDRYALELFHRAVAGRDDEAWESICRIYRDHMIAWCRRSGVGEDDIEEFLNVAWAKFWTHYSPDKLRAAGTLAGVLTYLRMCVRSVVLDAERCRTHATDLDAAGDLPTDQPSPDDRCADNDQAQTIWRRVTQRLHDQREVLLMSLIYQAGLRPAEVYARHPGLFAGIGEVYRINRNILDRLRRDPELRAWRATE